MPMQRDIKPMFNADFTLHNHFSVPLCALCDFRDPRVFIFRLITVIIDLDCAVRIAVLNVESPIPIEMLLIQHRSACGRESPPRDPDE